MSEAWLAGLRSRERRPTGEQEEVLRAVVARVREEASEEQRAVPWQEASEPLFQLLHGVPGSGKSEVLQWIREVFETALGWKHGTQFVYLAVQNLMAAQIGRRHHSSLERHPRRRD